MSNKAGTAIAIALAAGVGYLLLSSRSSGAAQVDTSGAFADLMGLINGVVDGRTNVTTPTQASPGGAQSEGVTGLARDVLLDVINAPLNEGQVRPVANFETGTAYQPVLTDTQEVVFVGSDGQDWVMRNGKWELV